MPKGGGVKVTAGSRKKQVLIVTAAILAIILFYFVLNRVYLSLLPSSNLLSEAPFCQGLPEGQFQCYNTTPIFSTNGTLSFDFNMSTSIGASPIYDVEIACTAPNVNASSWADDFVPLDSVDGGVGNTLVIGQAVKITGLPCYDRNNVLITNNNAIFQGFIYISTNNSKSGSWIERAMGINMLPG